MVNDGTANKTCYNCFYHIHHLDFACGKMQRRAGYCGDWTEDSPHTLAETPAGNVPRSGQKLYEFYTGEGRLAYAFSTSADKAVRRLRGNGVRVNNARTSRSILYDKTEAPEAWEECGKNGGWCVL